MEPVSQPVARAVEFGIYRDGDNNLDASQGVTLRQALDTSNKDSRVEYTVQDTTSLRHSDGDIVEGKLRTDNFTIGDGKIGQASIDKAHDMASPKNLAQFVARTLDNAQKSGAKQTWIELTDHGAGDGGGLEADSARGIMSMPDIADAIADGVKLHAQEHPEDAGRGVDGVVANQCLMSSLGFAEGYYIRAFKRPVLGVARAEGQMKNCLHESAAMTFSLRQVNGAWKITNQSWTSL